MKSREKRWGGWSGSILGIRDCGGSDIEIGLESLSSPGLHSRLPPFPQRTRKEWGTRFYVWFRIALGRGWATRPYKFHDWGFAAFVAAFPAGSIEVHRPCVIEYERKSMWLRLVSESSCWPVKCIGLTSLPVQVSPSPNGRLVQVSTIGPLIPVRTRSVPCQSVVLK